MKVKANGVRKATKTVLGKSTTRLKEVYYLREHETLYFGSYVEVSRKVPTSSFICHAHCTGKLHVPLNH
jgi:hypothetical protein